jgi:hypothetical protein
MNLLEFHYQGHPFIITRDSFKGVIPAVRNGKPTGKYVLVTDDEGTSGLEVDENYDEIHDALAVYEIECVGGDNDETEDDEGMG